jgi:hypothetical protein
MIIKKDTKLCLFNSRWGSRLTLNLNFSEHSIETGNLGMDVWHNNKNNYEKQKLRQLKFYIKSGSSEEEGFYFSKLNSYLANQELSAGLTSIKLIGVHSSELIVNFEIRSPITYAPKLENDEKIKILNSPFFYIEFTIENISKIKQNIESFIALDLNGLLINEDIYYDDKGINNIDKRKKELVLRSLQKETDEYYIDDEKKFKGFSSKMALKPGEKLQYKYIYAGFTDGNVFLNKINEKKPQKLKFYYTKFFVNIEQVLNYAESKYKMITDESNEFENLLSSYEASSEKKMLIAIAFRTFLANTWLLISDSQDPEYYVWQGCKAMNSSIDIAMEVELLAKLFPWTLKLQLKEWKKYVTINKNGFAYLKSNMGFDQSISGEFSNENIMPVEDNANFTILLYWYYFISKDKEFLEDIYDIAFRLLIANKKRGFRNRGIANIDTTTTYYLSEALHKSPLNTYLGIKECIAYIMCCKLSEVVGQTENKIILQKEAEKILDTLEYTKKKYEYIPVSLDTSYAGWDQRTIATADPLFYVAMTGLNDPIIEKIVKLISSEFDNTYYICTRNLYGIRLVENEDITWFSKVAIIDAVSNILFKIPVDSSKYAYDWNKNNPNAYSDGALSETLESQNQKYPRGISLMWEIIYNYKK